MSNWYTEPEEDRRLLEKGAHLLNAAMAAALILAASALVAGICHTMP